MVYFKLTWDTYRQLVFNCAYCSLTWLGTKVDLQYFIKYFGIKYFGVTSSLKFPDNKFQSYCGLFVTDWRNEFVCIPEFETVVYLIKIEEYEIEGH